MAGSGSKNQGNYGIGFQIATPGTGPGNPNPNGKTSGGGGAGNTNNTGGSGSSGNTGNTSSPGGKSRVWGALGTASLTAGKELGKSYLDGAWGALQVGGTVLGTVLKWMAWPIKNWTKPLAKFVVGATLLLSAAGYVLIRGHNEMVKTHKVESNSGFKFMKTVGKGAVATVGDAASGVNAVAEKGGDLVNRATGQPLTKTYQNALIVWTPKTLLREGFDLATQGAETWEMKNLEEDAERALEDRLDDIQDPNSSRFNDAGSCEMILDLRFNDATGKDQIILRDAGNAKRLDETHQRVFVRRGDKGLIIEGG